MSAERVDLVGLLRRRESRAAVGLSIALALGLHFIFGAGAWRLPDVAGVRSVDDRQAVSVRHQSAADRQRVELTVDRIVPPPTPVIPPPPPPPDPTGQVVALPPSADPPPAAADYLSETDHRTERETKARITGLTPQHTARPTQAEASTKATEKAPADGETSSTMPPSNDTSEGGPVGDGKGTEGDALAWDRPVPGSGAPQLALSIPTLKAIQGLQSVPTDRGQIPVRPSREGRTGTGDEALALALGRVAPLAMAFGNGTVGGGMDFSRRGGSGGDGAPGRANLMPSLAQLERMSGLPSADHLVVEEDDATSLNTFAYRHATFFNRVHDAIARVWQGREVMQAVDPTGRVYGNFDQHVLVSITIDTDGNVLEVNLAQNSTAEAYDDEAIQAVKRASPFPNPPRGLFRGGDRFTFNFGFTLDYNRRSVDLNWAPY